MPTPNAPLFFEGAMNVLTPYIESGKLVVKSGQTEFNVVATAEWDGAKAQSRMDAILSTYYLDEPIEAVLCQNDDLAAGVISACKSAGYGTEASASHHDRSGLHHLRGQVHPCR